MEKNDAMGLFFNMLGVAIFLVMGTGYIIHKKKKKVWEKMV